MIKKPYTPQSREVAKQLIAEIRNGGYQPGEKLESVRILAGRYGVGRQVALSAVSLMARQNYVYTARGSGTYVNPQLKPGLYYRLGFFVNRLNPTANGKNMYFAQLYATANKFHLVPGSNFEENFTLKEWLKSKSDLDGVIVTGLVEEEVLKYPRQHHYSYIVLGNYDISPDHPQVNYDVRRRYCEVISGVIKQHGWQKIAAVTGVITQRADREAREGICDAIKQSGRTLYEDMIINARDDGYQEISHLLRTRQPDVIIFCASHWQSWQKYLYLHKSIKYRPEIVININPELPHQVPPDFYDYQISLADPDENEKIAAAIDFLISKTQVKRR